MTEWISAMKLVHAPRDVRSERTQRMQLASKLLYVYLIDNTSGLHLKCLAGIAMRVTKLCSFVSDRFQEGT
jgi:hypothetical protein